MWRGAFCKCSASMEIHKMQLMHRAEINQTSIHEIYLSIATKLCLSRLHNSKRLNKVYHHSHVDHKMVLHTPHYVYTLQIPYICQGSTQNVQEDLIHRITISWPTKSFAFVRKAAAFLAMPSAFAFSVAPWIQPPE